MLRGTAILSLGAILSLSVSAFAQDSVVPHVFESGTPARASEVNDNFAAVIDGINANQAAIAAIPAGPPGPPGPPGPSAGRPALVTLVAKSGGDYTNPLDAVTNVATGDAWCRDNSLANNLSDYCTIVIAPGVYELSETLVVPSRVAIVGSGRDSTVLAAGQGLQIAVELGDQTISSGYETFVRDLSIENRNGDGSLSIGVASTGPADSYYTGHVSIRLANVSVYAAGSAENIALRLVDVEGHSYDAVYAVASGGMFARGMLIEQSSLTLEHCGVTARDGSTNVAIVLSGSEFTPGALRAENCTFSASGGNIALGVSSNSRDKSIDISRSSIAAANASQRNAGISLGNLRNRGRLSDVRVRATSLDNTAENVAIDIYSVGPPREQIFERVNAAAERGARNVGVRVRGDFEGGQDSVRIADSEISGIANDGGIGFGVQLIEALSVSSPLATIDRSSIRGETAALSVVDSSDLFIGTTHLEGGVVFSGLGLTCAGVYDAAYTFYADSCPP